jgi:superfamily II DNA/RNA helicase
MSHSFADLGASRQVVNALARRGIKEPFAVQALVVPDVLDGHDVLVQSPTGSGKTLAFGVPIVDRIAADARLPSALVLAPTRELAGQIVEALDPLAQARGLRIAAVYGGVGIEPQIKRSRRAHILVATPGRLEDLLKRRAVTLEYVRFLVIDEADRMLDMGFKPSVDRIVNRTPSNRQTLFFSATLEGVAGRQASAYTRDARRHVHEPAETRRGDIDHQFVHLNHDAKLDALVNALRVEGRGRTLVFVRTKRGADRLVKRLQRHDLKAVGMHGNKSQSQRQRALDRFDAGHIDTLVATDVAARGIDVADITHVINFDAPADRDTYVHRVGRTGRAGRTGTGVSFVIPEQAGEMRQIARDLGLSREFGTADGQRESGRRRRPAHHKRYAKAGR